LPFGEELVQGAGGRTSDEGYTNIDATRQKFTAKERDIETGLDYFLARYYSSPQGRFTGIDTGPFTPADPQNFNRYSYAQNNPLKFIDPSGREIELTGDKAQDFIDYLERKSGLKLKYKTKNGVTTITGSKKDKNFTGTVDKEFAKIVKNAAGANETAKFNVSSNMTNQQGNDVFMDDNGDAWDSRQAGQPLRAGNVDMADIQSVDSQTPELGMALVGHFLIEGVEMRKFGANYYNTGTPGAHDIGLEAERKILSSATGAKQGIRYVPPISGQLTVGTPFSFVYTTVQYDMTIKSSGVTVNKVTPPTVARPKK
jgi:RHS repeat-associated protein